MARTFKRMVGLLAASLVVALLAMVTLAAATSAGRAYSDDAPSRDYDPGACPILTAPGLDSGSICGYDRAANPFQAPSARGATSLATKGVDDLARVTSDRQRRLGRLATAGTAEGRGVRNFDVPDPAAAAHNVTRSLTRGEGVTVTQPRPGVAVHGLPEGGQVVLRSPQGSRSGLWAVDAYGVPGAPGRVRTHFRPRP